MQPCSTLADRPTAGPSDRLPLRLIRPARPTRETGRHPGNPSAPRDLLTGSPAVYTAFMELRDRPPAVCTYVVMHDRMNKKGDMLEPTYLYRYLRVLRSVYIESGRPRVGVGGGGAGVSMGKEARKV